MATIVAITMLYVATTELQKKVFFSALFVITRGLIVVMPLCYGAVTEDFSRASRASMKQAISHVAEQ